MLTPKQAKDRNLEFFHEEYKKSEIILDHELAKFNGTTFTEVGFDVTNISGPVVSMIESKYGQYWNIKKDFRNSGVWLIFSENTNTDAESYYNK